MESRKTGKVLGYSEQKMKRIEIGNFKTYEYHFPFNYKNVNVVRNYNAGETHGIEMNSINSYWPETERKPSDYIEIEEEQPIVNIKVIGSACTPPGYIMLSAETIEGFRRNDEVADIMPVRFRIGNLWGMHLRADQWMVKETDVTSIIDGSIPYDSIPEGFIEKNPNCKGFKMKMDYRELPLSGMSCADFSIPMSRKIKIMAGSEILGWHDDNFPDDAHYSIRMVRLTVCEVFKE